MTTVTMSQWQPGTDLPYVIPVGDESMLAILLPAAWLKADRAGQPTLLPPAVRAVDRLRATFAHPAALSPGFIVSLREAMELTQAEFGRRIGVSKMTVSRWERGRMRPSDSAADALRKLQRQIQREGVRIDGTRR